MNDQYVTVEQYQFLPEAQAIQMHLESKGIPALLADAETVSTDWALGNAIGYIKLQVPQSHAEVTLNILDDLRARRLEREKTPEQDDAGQCLSCGHALRPDAVKCSACGWSFADSDVSPADSDRETLTAKSIDDTDQGLLDNLRSIKRPLMTVFVAPLVIGFIITLLLVAMMILDQLVLGD